MVPAIGQTGEVTRTVSDALSAHTLGNPNVHVLATPCLAGLCEDAARLACDQIATRRMRVDIRHLAATPVGDEIRIFAEIVSVEDELVICRIDGRDSTGEIVSGRVFRTISA